MAGHSWGERRGKKGGSNPNIGAVRGKGDKESRSNLASLQMMFEAPESKSEDSVLDAFEEQEEEAHAPLSMLDMLSSAEDRTTKEEVIGGPNADRAAGTYDDIMGLEGVDELDPLVLESLISGVATPMTDNDFGQRGVIGRKQAGHAASTFMGLDEKDQERMLRLLGKDAEDPQSAPDATQRALILKAMAARSGALTTGGEDKSKAMSELSGFAFETGGMDRDELVRKTTAFDLEGGEEGQGLTQRYQDSCGPSVFQLLKADADPVTAMKFHQDDLSGLGRKGPVGKEQTAFLDAVGKSKKRREKKGFKRFFEKGEGISNSNLRGAVETNIQPMLGLQKSPYVMNTADSETDRSKLLGKTDPALKHGVSAPMSIKYEGDAGHFMAISDVREIDGEKKYLINDPWTGRSMWKSEAEMSEGESDYGVGQGTFEGAMLDGSGVQRGKGGDVVPQYPE